MPLPKIWLDIEAVPALPVKVGRSVQKRQCGLKSKDLEFWSNCCKSLGSRVAYC